MLPTQTPELSLRDFEVRIGRAQLSRRKRQRSNRACERAGITIRNSDAEILQDRVVGNILDNIERHVSKVAFVAMPKPPRMLVLPSPRGSKANPTRGATVPQSGAHNCPMGLRGAMRTWPFRIWLK